VTGSRARALLGAKAPTCRCKGARYLRHLARQCGGNDERPITELHASNEALPCLPLSLSLSLPPSLSLSGMYLDTAFKTCFTLGALRGLGVTPARA